MKPIQLNFSGYTVKGTSQIILWSGDTACIKMKPFKVSKRKDIKDNLNDGGFGCQRIEGAVCDIYKNYEGHLVYLKTITINKVNEFTLETHYLNCL